MKNVSFPQVLLILCLLGAIVAAHFLGGGLEAAIAGAVATLIAWFAPPPSGGTGAATVTAVGAASMLVGCALFSQSTTRDALTQEQAGLLHCQEVGRQAPDGGNLAAYNSCVKEAGL